ncbi:MAG: heme exporter protein CcmB [Firmicutes bacterium]|nr:heme exporter protein CcmB [Dethiobacter sp.]MBS3889498.1 heme exporter protein CcmB [Bacillota bacterium]
MSWRSKSAAVCLKDLRLEFRTRYAYSALIMFAVTTLVAISFTLAGGLVEADIAASLLWIIFFFSAMTGVSRSFVQEEETGTSIGLKMAADPAPVFLGKFLFNAALLLSMAMLVVPLYLLLFNLAVVHVGGFLVTIFLGLVGLASAGTILSAIAAQSAVKGSLLTVLSLPILLPLLITATNATRTALYGGHLAGIMTDIAMLIFYNGTVLAASLLLFEYVWNE